MTTIFENQKAKLDMEHLYCVEKHHTISISVESKGFKGTSDFCVSTDDLNRIKSELKKAENSLEGTVKIKDYDSDAFIDLKFSSLGKVEIKGQIGASFNEHFMRFLFQADQTIVSSMITFVSESLQEA